MITSRGFAPLGLLIALVVIAALAGGGWWYASRQSTAPSQPIGVASTTPPQINQGVAPIPTQQVPSGWKTVHSSDLGFDISYPPTFRMGYDTVKEGGPSIGLDLVDDKDAQSLTITKGVYYDSSNCLISPTLDVVRTGTSTVNGIPFLFYREDASHNGGRVVADHYRTLHDGICYSIQTSANTRTAPPELLPVWNQVLASFKFTN